MAWTVFSFHPIFLIIDAGSYVRPNAVRSTHMCCNSSGEPSAGRSYRARSKKKKIAKQWSTVLFYTAVSPKHLFDRVRRYQNKRTMQNVASGRRRVFLSLCVLKCRSSTFSWFVPVEKARPNRCLAWPRPYIERIRAAYSVHTRRKVQRSRNVQLRR